MESVLYKRYLHTCYYIHSVRYYYFTDLFQTFASKKLSAVYIKPSTVCLRTCDLGHYFTQPVLQQPFVGRETISLELIEADIKNGKPN